MSGYMIVHGSCVGCNAFIAFNPEWVPSIRVNNKREPLCRACHSKWNEIHRTSKGLKPVALHPQAYKPEVT